MIVFVLFLTYVISVDNLFGTKLVRENKALNIKMTHVSFEYESLEIPPNLIPMFNIMQKRIESLERHVKHLDEMSRIGSND